MKRNKKITGIIFIGLVFIWLAWNLFKTYQFKHNYSFVNGRVTRIDGPGWKSSGDYAVLYEYLINGKKYTGNNNYNFCGDLNFESIRTLLQGKTFPILYSDKDKNQSILILTKANAEKYNYKMLDSLLIYDSILTCK